MRETDSTDSVSLVHLMQLLLNNDTVMHRAVLIRDTLYVSYGEVVGNTKP